MTAARTLPPIAILDGLPADEFAGVVGPLFENAPTFVATLAASRPFASYEALWPAALEIAIAMPEAAQVELIDAHPRLGAPPASVSAMSFREQGYGSSQPKAAGAAESARAAQAADTELAAQAAQASGAVAAELERLNQVYEARFGFRYCVFVNGRSRAELIPGMVAALEADRASEIERALGEIVTIAEARSRTLTP